MEQYDNSNWQRALNDFHHRLHQPDGLSSAAVVIATLGGIVPVLWSNGFGRLFSHLAQDLSSWQLTGIAAVSCAIAFSLWYPDRRFWYAGILPGLIAGPLMAYATYWYTKERQMVWNWELAFPLLVGALPGGYLYYHSLRRLVIQDILDRQVQAQQIELEKDSSAFESQSAAK